MSEYGPSYQTQSDPCGAGEDLCAGCGDDLWGQWAYKDDNGDRVCGVCYGGDKFLYLGNGEHKAMPERVV